MNDGLMHTPKNENDKPSVGHAGDAPAQDLTRRTFLGLLGVGTASVMLAGCASGTESLETADAQAPATLSETAPVGEVPGTAQGASAAEFAETIHSLENDGTLTLLWVTDSHYLASDTVRHAKVPEYLDVTYEVADALNPAALIVSGDIVDGSETLDVHDAGVATMVAKLQESPVPLLAVRGNHDDNSFYTQNITQNNSRDEVVDTAWLAEHLIGPLLDDACVANPNQRPGCTYYYRDFPEAKIRAVVLDSVDVPYTVGSDGRLNYCSLIEFGVGYEQVAWLADTALKFDEEGWAVLVLSHVNLDDNRPYGLRAWGEVPVLHNDSAVIELLSAYASGGSGRLVRDDPDFALNLTYDFSDNPSNELIGCINGHTHRDQCHFQDGILSITLRGLTEGAPARISALLIDREAGLVRARAFDVVSGEPVDWDLGYRDGSGIPAVFNYYYPGTYVTDDGMQAG